MVATIIISALLLVAVVFAVRSIVRSRRSGGCDACGDSAPCSSCSPDIRIHEERPHK